MSSALKIAWRYKDITSIGLHFERIHISVVVKAGCNLEPRMPARNDIQNLSLKYCGKEEKSLLPLFYNIFNISLTPRVNYIYIC